MTDKTSCLNTKIICTCERCEKEVDEIYEVNDEYICLNCLDDRNNAFELLGELKNEEKICQI